MTHSTEPAAGPAAPPIDEDARAGILAAEAVAPVMPPSVPESLSARLERHEANMRGLAAALLSGGQGEAAVREIVERAARAYADDLSAAIIELRENAHA